MDTGMEELLVNILGFSGCLGVVCVNGICSVCDVEPTMAWGCAVISDFCLSDKGSTYADLLGCEDVTTSTFLLRPALPCPNLGFFPSRGPLFHVSLLWALMFAFQV